MLLVVITIFIPFVEAEVISSKFAVLSPELNTGPESVVKPLMLGELVREAGLSYRFVTTQLNFLGRPVLLRGKDCSKFH